MSAYASTCEYHDHRDDARERRATNRDPELRLALLSRRAELERAIQQRADIAAERLPDAMENAEMHVFREAEAQDRRRKSDSLRDVEAAIARLDAGMRTECQECGGRIPEKRLVAHPAAVRCVGCQAQREAARA